MASPRLGPLDRNQTAGNIGAPMVEPRVVHRAALNTDEHSLVARVRAGDPRAFETIFRAHHPALCDFVYRYTRSRAEAEEIVHDVFARIWERRAEWIVHGELRTYLFGAARNRAFNALKRLVVDRRWRDGARQDAVRGAPGWATGTVVNGAEERLEAEEVDAVIERTLAGLSDRCRLAVTLRWRRQLTYAEIAEAMGISIKTVEIYITRGTKVVRAAYAEIRTP
jgi:RNA polymerase sigma-70 factor (ECF subfamily)